MKILKRGIAEVEVPIQATCRECKTEFEFMQHESTYVADLRDGDYLEIGCPVCVHRVTVSMSVVRDNAKRVQNG